MDTAKNNQIVLTKYVQKLNRPDYPVDRYDPISIEDELEMNFKILSDFNTMVTYLNKIERRFPVKFFKTPELINVNPDIIIAFTILRLEKSYLHVTWDRLVEMCTIHLKKNIDNLLHAIQFRLFPVDRKLPPANIVKNLTRFYVKLCLKLEDYAKIEILAFDSFYTMKTKYFIVLKILLYFYPELLPKIAFLKPENILACVLLDTIFQTDEKKSKHVPLLLKILRKKYNYVDWRKHTAKEVANILFTKLRENNLTQIEASIIVFTKRVSWRRANIHLLKSHAFSTLSNIQRDINLLPEEATALCIRSLAYVSMVFPMGNSEKNPAAKEIQAVSEHLMSLVVRARNMPKIVRKSLQYAVACHGRVDFINMTASLLMFDLKGMDKKIVKLFLCYRFPEFWHKAISFLFDGNQSA